MNVPASVETSRNGSVAAHNVPGAATGAPDTDNEPVPEPGFWRTLWTAWKAYSKRGGGYQSQVLLSLVYFLVLGPSALVSRLFGNRLLDLGAKKRPTYWIERPPADTSLSALERQF